MKFSIIVPVYKVEQFLPKCVESITRQSCSDYEIILVDDGSPDQCPIICDQFAKGDPRIHVIHKSNGGLSSARNAGIASAAGEYIILVDSDDFWNSNDVLGDLSAHIEADRADVILFRARSWNETLGKSRVKLSPYKQEIVRRFDRVLTLHYLFSEGQLPTGAYLLAVKKEVLERNDIRFIEGIKSEDYDWIMSILLNSSKIDASDEIHYVYRLGRAGSITNTVDLKHIKDLMITVSKWCDCSWIQDDTIRRDVLNYIAYIYSTALILAARLSAADRRLSVQVLKPYKFVTKYGYWKSLRMIRVALLIIGIKRTGWLLNKVYHIKLRRELQQQ